MHKQSSLPPLIIDLLKAEIDPEAWAILNSDTSRLFEKPKSGRIAVKVITTWG
jgi:adenine-specific DNA-methyltransferase